MTGIGQQRERAGPQATQQLDQRETPDQQQGKDQRARTAAMTFMPAAIAVRVGTETVAVAVTMAVAVAVAVAVMTVAVPVVMTITVGVVMTIVRAVVKTIAGTAVMTIDRAVILIIATAVPRSCRMSAVRRTHGHRLPLAMAPQPRAPQRPLKRQRPQNAPNNRFSSALRRQ
jgi:hypothetical protein